MSKGKSKQKIKNRRVTFSLEATAAKEVVLAGNFNNWSLIKHPMKRDEKGRWNKTVVLSPGKYEYKFLVDGQWREDPRNHRLCPNCFGTQNSILDLTIS